MRKAETKLKRLRKAEPRQFRVILDNKGMIIK